MVAALAVAYSCEPKEEPQDVTIQLTQNDVNYAKEGITVTVSGPATFEAATNAQGVATFSLPVGIYDASVAFRGIDASGVVTNCNGKTAITVVDKKADPNAVNDFKLPVIASQGSQLIIKEVYAGGCQKNDNSGTYANDKYIILYNNAGTNGCLPRCRSISGRSTICLSKNAGGFRNDTRNMTAVISVTMPSGSSGLSLSWDSFCSRHS